jgi:ATP-dependent RNA helicase DHX36
MDPPEPSAVENALAMLRALGALDEAEMLTPLGRHLVTLPVEPAIGRMLLLGAVFDCLDSVLTIAASLTFRSPFVLPMDDDARRRADDAKRRLAHPHASDHFALLHAFEEFRRLQATERPAIVFQWCRAHFVSKDTLELIKVQRLELAQVRWLACLPLSRPPLERPSLLGCVCLMMTRIRTGRTASDISGF